MNAAVERMWTARKKMCIGYDNAMGLLMLGWRVIDKNDRVNNYLDYPNLTIQSLDKTEWKRLYKPTYFKLQRKGVLVWLNSEKSTLAGGQIERSTLIYGLRKGA